MSVASAPPGLSKDAPPNTPKCTFTRPGCASPAEPTPHSRMKLETTTRSHLMEAPLEDPAARPCDGVHPSTRVRNNSPPAGVASAGITCSRTPGPATRGPGNKRPRLSAGPLEPRQSAVGLWDGTGGRRASGGSKENGPAHLLLDLAVSDPSRFRRGRRAGHSPDRDAHRGRTGRHRSWTRHHPTGRTGRPVRTPGPPAARRGG